MLNRLDPAFRLDPASSGFVQDRMIAHGADLLDWLSHRDAVLYACGHRATVGDGTRTALRTSLATDAGPGPSVTETTIAAWQADGRLRFDLTA